MRRIQPKILFVILFSVCLVSFLGFSFHQNQKVSFDADILKPDAEPDSLQLLVNNYYKLRLSKDSIQRITDIQKNEIKENSKNIELQKQKAVEAKTSKAKISSKSLHKARVTLTKEDKRNLIMFDSIISRSETEIRRLQKKNEQANNLLLKLEKDSLNNMTKFKMLYPVIANYTACIRGSRAVVFQHVAYHIFVADLDSDELRMHLYNANDKNKHFYTPQAVKKYLESEKRRALMITNAGMYISSYDPQGLYVENRSKTFFPLDTEEARSNANFYLKPNGIFYLDVRNIPHIDSTEQLMRYTEAELRKFRAATQSGPMLVINGAIHRAFMPDSKNKKIRSGVGLIDGNNHKVVFAITKDESNFYDFASFFRDIFDCRNALFLDGAISQMYLPDIAPRDLDGNFGPMISISRKQGK